MEIALHTKAMTQHSIEMPSLSAVRDFLECPLCLQMYNNPHKVQCGHRFCEVCLYNMTRNEERVCPLDGKRITPENAVIDSDLQAKMQSVIAECPQMKKGCEWKGHVNDVHAHKMTCPFTDVNCPKGCGKVLLRMEIASHVKKNCISTFARCKNCYVEMSPEQLQVHECPCEKYQCPAGCGQKDMTLEELKRHRHPSNGQCIYMKVNCKFKDAGCTYVGTKQDMESHIKQSCDEHTNMLCQSLSNMTNKQKETEKQVQRQSEQLKTIQESFCQYAIFLKEFQTKQQELLEQISEQQSKITSHEQQLATKDNLINEMKLQLDQCHDVIDELKNGSTNGTLIWKLENFRESLNNALLYKSFSIYSPIVMTSKFGYKLCAQLFPAGSTDCGGDYMSIYFHLLATEHDDVLKWPFSHKISFTLIDQVENGEAKNISYTIVPAPNASNYQKPDQKMSGGRGCHQFVSLEVLESRNYIKNDCIFIKIKVLQKS